MTSIIIVCAPQGSAPNWLREAWVGSELPGKNGNEEPHENILAHDVSSNKVVLSSGYVIDIPTAISVLEKKHPGAAEWWCDNTDYVHEGRKFIFESECCSKVG